MFYRDFWLCDKYVFHNYVQIITKKRLGLVLFSTDGRVIAEVDIFLACV